MEHDKSQRTKPESAIERWLGKRLRLLGCLYLKLVSPGNAGVPDRIIILPRGRIIFAELKTADGQLSPIQAFCINRLQSMGCDVRIVYGHIGATALLAEIKEELNSEL